MDQLISRTRIEHVASAVVGAEGERWSGLSERDQRLRSTPYALSHPHQARRMNVAVPPRSWLDPGGVLQSTAYADGRNVVM